MDSVIKSNTFLFCILHVDTTVIIRSRYKVPLFDCVPKLVLRQMTSLRRICSARLLVGSTLSFSTNVHSASFSLKMCLHIPAVFLLPQRIPSFRRISTLFLIGIINFLNCDRRSVPSFTLCQYQNIFAAYEKGLIPYIT